MITIASAAPYCYLLTVGHLGIEQHTRPLHLFVVYSLSSSPGLILEYFWIIRSSFVGRGQTHNAVNVNEPEYEYFYSQDDYEGGLGADKTESPMLKDGELINMQTLSHRLGPSRPPLGTGRIFFHFPVHLLLYKPLEKGANHSVLGCCAKWLAGSVSVLCGQMWVSKPLPLLVLYALSLSLVGSLGKGV